MGFFDIFKQTKTPILDRLSVAKRDLVGIYTKTWLNMTNGIIDPNCPMGVREGPFSFEHEALGFTDMIMLASGKSYLVSSYEELLASSDQTGMKDFLLKYQSQGDVPQDIRISMAASSIKALLDEIAKQNRVSFEALSAESARDQGLV